MENIPQQDLELSRRAFISGVACATLGGAFSTYETWTPKPTQSSVAEVVVANLAFISPTRLDGLIWNTSDWAKMLNHTDYDGLEAHIFNTQDARIVGAPLTELLSAGMVQSLHQSVRSDNDYSLQSRVLPTSTASLQELHDAEAKAGKSFPVVVFPEGNLAAIHAAQRENYFASYSAQPGVGLFKKAGAKSLQELQHWLTEQDISLCWSTFHYQESEQQFGRRTLGNWQDVLPDVADALGETHLEIGRIDGDPHLKERTMQELIAFVHGPEEAVKTTSGQMLQTIFAALPKGERTRVVVEVNQAGLVQHLGASAVWPFLASILKSHRRIAQTVRDIAESSA